MADNNPPVTLAADPGYAALAPELRGALENKGWSAKSPFEAAVEAMKSYTEVERHLGIPRDQLLRLPKDAADTEGWKAFNSKVGVPEKVEGYDLTGVKFADGTALNEQFAGALKSTFLAEGIPAARAAAIASGVVKYMDGTEAAETVKLQAALAEGKTKLAQSWGANADAFKFVAGQAVTKLGLSKDFIEQVEKTAGYHDTMQMLLKLGQMMGEDRLVSNDLGDGKKMYTREQAQARKRELYGDSGWVSKVNAGDAVANQELMALDRIIAGVAAAA